MILNYLIPALGIALAFSAGYLLAEKAAHERERAVEHALIKQRIELGYNIPPYTWRPASPSQETFESGGEFDNKLRAEGQATVMLSPKSYRSRTAPASAGGNE